MRRPSFNAAISSNAVELTEADMGKKLADASLLPLLRAVCEVLDLAAEGEDVFLTIGKTRNKGALLLTITWDGVKQFATADNPVELASEVAKLLVPD